MTIPVMRPALPEPALVLPRLMAVRESGIYSNFGPQVMELESRLARRLHVSSDCVVTATNATLALTGAMTIAGALRWVVPSFTFTASVAAALLTGSPVRMADVSATWWLDTGRSTPSEGIVPVAPFGAAVDLGPWLGRESVVIDAAASLGSDTDLSGLPGSWAVVFSLHATKALGSGEGAIVVFGDADRAREFRMWSNFGFSEQRESRIAGTNAKMSELQAAYAHVVLDDWEQEQSEWLAARERALSVGDDVGLTTFRASREAITPYWVVVLPDAATTDLVERVLEEHSIGTRRWWARGCHRMPAYAEVPRDPLPVTEDVAGRYLGLPMYRGLSAEDAERIHTALLEARNRAEAW